LQTLPGHATDQEAKAQLVQLVEDIVASVDGLAALFRCIGYFLQSQQSIDTRYSARCHRQPCVNAYRPRSRVK
jgi:hypothetical protein